MAKRFVLDTNILLAFPHCIMEDFDDNTVIICGTVIQELDKKKTAEGEIGYNAREAGRLLEKLRLQGDLLKGVQRKCGGTLLIEPDGVKQEYLPAGFSIDVPDNRIISSCIHLNRQNPSESPVILVTSDVWMRIAASACGIETQDFRKVMVQDTGYTGHIRKECDWEMIDRIYKEKELEVCDEDLLENEFVTLYSGNLSAPTVYRHGKLQLIGEQKLFGWVQPKNIMQTYMMWALAQPAEEIPLVILEGPAGSAKTFLSIAAGMDGTYTSQRRRDNMYDKILLTRPVAHAFDGEQGTGYLPGTLEEKLHYLYQSYYDNLEDLLKSGVKEDSNQIKTQMQDLFMDGIVEVGTLSSIRGRSLKYTYMICDEAQNASRTLVRDIITRPGDGTKIILAGDPSQIDVPELSAKNNGLVTAASCMAGSSLCAYLKLDKESVVRSALAREAIERMRW